MRTAYRLLLTYPSKLNVIENVFLNMFSLYLLCCQEFPPDSL